MSTLRGYLKFDFPVSVEAAERVRQHWESCLQVGKTPVLTSGVHFVPLNDSALDPVIVTCGHCGQWAARQTECAHCGAPVL